MGVYIQFSVDEARVRRGDWESAFADAVEVARAGKLCDTERVECDGHAYYAGIVAPVKELGDAYGLSVFGELKTGSTMESHFIPQCLGVEAPKTSTEKNILALYLSNPEDYGQEPPNATPILFNKTQGRPGHIWLLAMACVFCDRFPDATYLDGDITAGQVYRAMELAGEVLGCKLNAPVAFDMEQLLPRVHTLAEGDALKAARLFFEIYKGLRDEDFNRFVKEHFSCETLYALFRGNARDKSIHSIFADWLLLGLPFRDAARMLVADPEGPQHTPEDFAKEVLRAKLHIKEKFTYDPAEAGNELSNPDDVQMQFSRVAATMFGIRNWAIDRYIPLDELKADCAAVFDDGADVDALFAGAARELEQNKNHLALEEFWSRFQDSTAEKREQVAGYDIVGAEGLFYWEVPEDTIAPALWDKLTYFLRRAREVTANTRREFFDSSRDERIAFLTSVAGNRLLLPRELWQALFDCVADDAEIDLWLPLLCVNAGSAEGDLLLRVLLYNAPLLRYLNATMSEEASDEVPE